MTFDEYRNFVIGIQNNLDEDDCVYDIARDIISSNSDVKDFLVNELGEENPVKRLENDLY